MGGTHGMAHGEGRAAVGWGGEEGSPMGQGEKSDGLQPQAVAGDTALSRLQPVHVFRWDLQGEHIGRDGEGDTFIAPIQE